MSRSSLSLVSSRAQWFLHIGHVKAICLNFNLGERYNAPVNLRFDDTIPAKEEQQYVEAIKKTLNGWALIGTKNVMRQIILTQLYDWAKELIKKGYSLC